MRQAVCRKRSRLGERSGHTMASMKLPRKLARRLWHAHLGFQDHEGVLSAAGIAYYVALSFFPLLLVLVAGLGWVLQWTADRARCAAGIARGD